MSGSPELTRRFQQEILPHLDVAYRMGLALSRDPDRAEDLAQDSLLKALRGLDGLRPGTNPRSWLARVVHTTWLDQVRREGRRPEEPWDEGLDEVAAGAEDAWEPELMRRALNDCWEEGLDLLPAEWRTTLMLVEVEGFAYEETAEATGVPVGTVRSRLHRARSRLHDFLRQRSGCVES
jgi:RNA polymerase sigma-70 factor (ECF subfamily)